MDLVNGNECALLGLLVQRPRYGYELDKIIEEKLFREWTNIAFSSIYAILRGMEGKGWVESKSEIVGNRVRRQFALTRAGRKALRKAVESMIAEPAKENDDFMTAITNIGLLEAAEAAEALTVRRGKLKAQLARISKASEDATGRKAGGRELMLKRAEMCVKADIEFIDWYLSETPAKEKPKELESEPASVPETIHEEVRQKAEKIEEPAKMPELKPSIPEKPRETLF